MNKSQSRRTPLPAVIVRGAGDLATGTILRLHRSGFPVIALDIENPTVIRRTVSLAPALTDGVTKVEDVEARRAQTPEEAFAAIRDGVIPVMPDPEGKILEEYEPIAVIDAILAKKNLGTRRGMAPVTIGLGPGFTAGEDVDAVIETQRGHRLGRVIYNGPAIPNTGVPGMIGGYARERVIHAPAPGVIRPLRQIADTVEKGETIAEITTPDGQIVEVKPEISGVLRGMIADGMDVPMGFKIADVDPRDVRDNCYTCSDKANAIAGGALEALMHLTRTEDFKDFQAG